MHHSVIIIGAGLSGLTAANIIKSAGLDVIVLDKGRRVGGRVATRRDKDLLFNHGAQFVTARSAYFKAICAQAQKEKLLALWPESGRPDGYSGTPSMRYLAEFMARSVDVHQQVEICQITRNSEQGFSLFSSDERIFQADHIVLTAPAPQTARLLKQISPLLADVAQGAVYAPCWTVMLGLDDASKIAYPVLRPKTGIIGWATLESSRPAASQSTAVTIQATAEYSAQNLESPSESVIDAVSQAWLTLQGLEKTQISYSRAHRWRYARIIRPAQSEDEFMDEDNRGHIAIAGDWHPVAEGGPAHGARAEEAVLSGKRAAHRLIQKLS